MNRPCHREPAHRSRSRSRPCRGIALRCACIFRRFGCDQRGVISILGAFFVMLGLSMCVLVIDVGHLYLAKRRLQSAVDAAALAAAGNPESADAIVRTSLARNGYEGADIDVEAGTYAADPSVAVTDRMDPDSGYAPNAVRVTKTITTPDFFAGVFGADGLARITAVATAARIPNVSFSVGSGLAGLSAGDINQILGKLLGAQLSLSLVDYNGLASANVDALSLLNQLATRADLTTGTYGDLADANITLGQFLAAAQAALNAHPGEQNDAALQALNLLSLQVPPGASARLGALMDTSLWRTRRIGTVVEQKPGQATMNLFGVITAMARLYAAGHLADLGSGLSIPVANSSVSAYISAGEPWASMTAGPVGSALSTSQMRLALTVTVANVNLGIAKAVIRVPVYVQMANGGASVASIPCRPDGTRAVITATPMAVRAQIGEVDTGTLSDYGSVPAPQQPTIVSLTVLGIPVDIQASAAASVAAGPSQELDFRQDDIDAGTVKSAGADTSHLMSDMAADLVLNVRGTGTTGVVDSVLAGTVMPLLRPVVVSILSSLDPVVSKLLQVAGLRLGVVSVAVRGVNCGHPTIVG